MATLLNGQPVGDPSDPKQASTKKSPAKLEKQKTLVGLEGWLALFVVAVSLGILLGLINLFGYSSAFSDLLSAQADAPQYVAAATPVLWFEVLTNIASIGIAIWLIVLLVQRKKLAKTIAIAYLAFSAVFLTVDYIWAASIFESFNLTQFVQAEMQSAGRDVARGFVGALIWIPYFMVSKRVKATLTK